MSFDKVEAQSVFACDLVTHWEVVDSLILVETLIQEGLARAARPQDVPLVGVSIGKVVCLQETAHELCVSVQNFVKHFEVIHVVTALACLVWRLVVKKLTALDRLNLLKLVDAGVRGQEVIAIDWSVWVDFLLLVKVLRSAVFHIVATWQEQREILFHVFQRFEDFQKNLIALILSLEERQCAESPRLVAHLAGAWPTGVLSIDPCPDLLLLGLNHL